jgi:hypothetical protein
MNPVRIYQIYYSEDTKKSLDDGFIPLDNRGQRPDWREYLPIRKFLQENPLDEDTLYGFFSWKFRQKTGLDSAAVYAFIDGLTAPVDVVSFSPFFDQGAFHLNTFEQAAVNHPGIWPTWESVVPLVAPGTDPHTVVMDSRQSIFCNYFAAKPSFWRTWLQKCELIFLAAERDTGRLSDQLNLNVAHDNGVLPAKVFVIERMASLLLVTSPAWRVSNFDPMRLRSSGSGVSRFAAELVMLDALKQSANTTHHDEYMQTYWALRTAMASAMA